MICFLPVAVQKGTLCPGQVAGHAKASCHANSGSNGEPSVNVSSGFKGRELGEDSLLKNEI
jgi:hypothetical protein